REDVAARGRSSKPHTIIATAGHRILRHLHHVVGVHKIEAAEVRKALPERMRRLPYLVPAHVRHFHALAELIHLIGEPAHHAGKQPQAVNTVVFLTVAHQRLHANTDAQQRPALGGHAEDRLVQLTLFQHRDTVTNGANTGKDHAISGTNHRRVTA